MTLPELVCLPAIAAALAVTLAVLAYGREDLAALTLAIVGLLSVPLTVCYVWQAIRRRR